MKKIVSVLKVGKEEAAKALESLREKYNQPTSGIILMQNGDEWQLVSNPDNHEAAENFLKAEAHGELTRPQLETLTVVSYCGPITKAELEQVRGVNCSLILRNLIMRGLIKELEKTESLLPMYEVTMDYLRHLGLRSLSDLPDYHDLHNHPYLNNISAE